MKYLALAILIVAATAAARPTPQLIKPSGPRSIRCVPFRLTAPPPPPRFQAVRGGTHGCPKEFALCVDGKNARSLVEQLTHIFKWMFRTIKSCAGTQV